ncbi:restriction endonuclease [Helicobacter canis]|uniref:Restriction endonuclease n=1 Tax=Helicobacter canis TaxID=29419 RepID=A0A5M9QI36_9HELI|nr:restriction endonuclease [Helicobacter canis]KAA8707719.1 restriction endonuclease [Helicobacter canis]
MRDFIQEILVKNNATPLFAKSPLLQYLNLKTSAVYSNNKARRSLANIYAVYAILYFYIQDFYENKKAYREFEGYEYTKLFKFYRSLYGGEKLQNHALNSRVNGEFKNKIVRENANDLIIINNGKYLLHIEYLYVGNKDIAKIAAEIIEKYIELLKNKDLSLISLLESLVKSNDNKAKKECILQLLQEDCEARIFEIIAYAILKNYYKNEKIYIGKTLDSIQEQYLELYKTGRTNANDGGIDFVMRPLGRFFQVSEVNDYDKYLLDIDKVLHFPITFVIKTKQNKESVLKDLQNYIEKKSCGMKIIKKRYCKAIEEIITINELIQWLENLDEDSVNSLIFDVNLYYKLELNLL